jgi:hypothetical protein
VTAGLANQCEYSHPWLLGTTKTVGEKRGIPSMILGPFFMWRRGDEPLESG